jgi:hypothetical protein
MVTPSTRSSDSSPPCDVPLLLFPTFPDGAVEVLPGQSRPTLRAREWICGDAPIPLKVHGDGISGQIARPNMGVGLVGAVAHGQRLMQTSRTSAGLDCPKRRPVM